MVFQNCSSVTTTCLTSWNGPVAGLTQPYNAPSTSKIGVSTSSQIAVARALPPTSWLYFHSASNFLTSTDNNRPPDGSPWQTVEQQYIWNSTPPFVVGDQSSTGFGLAFVLAGSYNATLFHIDSSLNLVISADTANTAAGWHLSKYTSFWTSQAKVVVNIIQLRILWRKISGTARLLPWPQYWTIVLTPVPCSIPAQTLESMKSPLTCL